ncbi:hypothetical protein IAU60_001613 [Kwoniella sp. DSM 27419]
MSTTQQAANGNQLSAFNALGSYADRIKDADGKPVKLTSASEGLPQEGRQPDKAQPSSHHPEPTLKATSSMPRSREQRTAAPAAAAPLPSSAAEDDGPWETVQSSRQRSRQEDKEKHGSNSKNWRDRSHREGQSSKDRYSDETEKRSSSRNHRKAGNSSESAPVVTAEKPARAAPQTTPATTSAPSKPAWGALARPSPAPATAPIPSSTSASPTANGTKDGHSAEPTVPPSPSLNGTTVTANSVSVPGSVDSPAPSSETASTSTAPASESSKIADNAKEEPSWRVKPKVESTAAEDALPQPQPKPEPPAPRQAAPPPAVNAWDLRKKKLATPPAPVATSSRPTIAPTPAQSVNKIQTNGQAKGDSTWPDVAQAAKAVKAEEESKERSKDRRNSESVNGGEENAGTGKKPKWTPIPAAELLAAADQAAEQSRRQSRLDASTKKRVPVAKADAESHTGMKAGKPRKSAPTDTRKGPAARTEQAGTMSDAKTDIPLLNNGDHASTLGSAQAEIASDHAQASTAQSLNAQSKDDSSSKAQAHNPVPAKGETTVTDGEFQSRPMVGSSTAPLPQQSFNPAAINGLPRVPRGRDARGSFNGRGRGGFRANSAMPHKAQGFGSPPTASNGLPSDGASGFQRNFAGFQPFYPVSAYAQQGIYDPMQAQYGAVYRGGLPPPPMPQTVVPNLDATRFYVLGQIEYYFSMQNLAMDFFLRQQMDSEGWIDVSMIASFNRVKSLTPEVAVVKECMLLSSLLEVREDKVRLAGEDAHRWVLPDAKPSSLGPDPMSPSGATEESRDLSLGIPASVESYMTNGNTGEDGQSFPTPAQQVRSLVAADVENALMKSSIASATANASASSATSVVNGEGPEKTETATPATSTSGDVNAREDEAEDAQSVKA